MMLSTLVIGLNFFTERLGPRARPLADAGRGMTGSVLEVRNLTLDYRTPAGWQRAVDDVSLDVGRGEVLGLVGESGSGKSTLAYQMLGYRQQNARLVGGSILFGGVDVATLVDRGPAKAARQPHRLRAAKSDHGAQSGHDGSRPDRGSAAASTRGRTTQRSAPGSPI